jgi:hypothetical protein
MASLNIDPKKSSEYIAIFKTYNKVIDSIATTNNKKKDLINLEKVYSETYVTNVNSRNHKYFTKEDLINVMKWKLTLGEMRGPLLKKIQENTPENVISTSKEAFALMEQNEDIKAIKKLCELNAVGPVTATALLCKFYERIPYLDDHTLMVCLGSHKYTMKAFKDVSEILNAKACEMNTINKITFWTAYKLSQLIWIREIK